MSEIRERILSKKVLDIKIAEEELSKIKSFYNAIESFLVGELEKIEAPVPWYISKNSFFFRCETSKEASVLAMKMLSIDNIGRFEKLFDTSNGTWYWEARWFKTLRIIISPATPNEDCTAKEIEKSYKSWICEKGDD